MKHFAEKINSIFRNNKVLCFFIGIYVILVFITLSWGLPNANHPYPYHMDEWHQLMAMKAIVKEGTTTIAGAAQIPFLYPVISGIYLLPFVAFQYVDPYSLKSPLENLAMQQRLFEVLRSVNLFFGIGSILLIAAIAKKFFQISYILPVLFFVLSPMLIMLSGYFKYDVALLFLNTLSIYLLYKFGDSPTTRNYIFAAIGCALALATKFSSLPLLLLLILAFYLFVPKKMRKKKMLFIGLTAFLITFIVVGIPNALFGKADFRELLYSNLVSTPQTTVNFSLTYPWWFYLPVIQYPVLFGHGFYFLGIVAFFYIIIKYIFSNRWKLKKNKNTIFLIIAFVLFAISLIPLKVWATGNRVLVLLPFLSLFIGLFCVEILKYKNIFLKRGFILLLFFIITIQTFEAGTWVYTKVMSDPQERSSEWIQRNIAKGSVIGIENIPIYQSLPNILLKEFYGKQYHLKQEFKYNYRIVADNQNNLPEYIVLTNSDIENKILKDSPKKRLLKHIESNGYRKLKTFVPELYYLNFYVSDETFYHSGLIASPSTISIYKKHN